MSDRSGFERRRKFLRDHFCGGGFATVSGILSTQPEMITEIDRRIPEIKLITTKSYQLEPNPGNREPVIVEGACGSFGNAVGLRNPGMERGLQDLRDIRRRHQMRALLNVSISASCPEDFARLAEGFAEVADTLELNFSCPHAAPGYGMSIGVDPELVYRYMQMVRRVSDLPLLPKLSPNVEKIGEIAQAALEGGADGLVAINTVGPELYLEKNSGEPLLINSHGGKGGKSGRWIRETALQKVAEIRSAIGDQVPLLGMGGVEDAFSVQKMRAAGVDLVGIGSAFALVRPPQWKAWFERLSRGLDTRTALGEGDGNQGLSIEQRQMEYRPCTIQSISEGPGGLRRIELDGALDYEPGQFAFIWLPGIGEKPFSLALSDPLTFLVRPRGEMTQALCTYEVGDTLYVRGVYGAGAELFDLEHLWILAGGTGLAVVPRLAAELAKQGRRPKVFCALSGDQTKFSSQEERSLFEQELSSVADYRIIADDGEIGRAVHSFAEEISSLDPDGRESAVYAVGPFPFMDAVAEASRRAGVDPQRIQLSIETQTRCGIGLCGECACAGRLTCREGTFFSLRELDDRGISIRECSHDH